MYDFDNNEDDFSFDEMSNTEQDLGGFGSPSEPVKTAEPKSQKSFVKIGTTFAVLMFLAVFLILLGRMWLTNRSSDQPVQNQPVVVDQTQKTTTPAPSPQTKGTYSNLVNNSTQAVPKGQLVKIQGNKSFSETYVDTGVVTEKGLLEVSGTSTYIGYVDFVLKNNSNSNTVTYFCNKDTLDNVNTGDNLQLFYQVDSEGKLIVVKVTR